MKRKQLKYNETKKKMFPIKRILRLVIRKIDFRPPTYLLHKEMNIKHSIVALFTK